MSDPLGEEPADDPYASPHQRENPRVLGERGSCLRTFAVWGLPALVVPLIVALFIQVWPVGAMVALAFLIWMGNIHAGNPVRDPWGITSPRWPKVLLYVVIQVVLIPLLWLALVLGFCAVTGTGTLLIES